ncbi:hypothetical protein [Plastoroseomonas hellenica]|uniref:hypothetical protein n=1 Tax=Plastoroseomonas hellenica TaxID=2687306 RepID=UPI001BA96F08|nr:hypothetical protein [Plastoroseomonas hellenica]MBR0642937.1 hypothetical protein [Plastoroseomonas hellenica]
MLRTPNAVLSLGGRQEESADLPGRVEATGDAITKFELPLIIAEVAIAVAGADIARLTFDEMTPFALGLHRVGTPRPGGLSLGAPGPFDLPLRGARLRVRRGRDLLDLAFRFRDFDLRFERDRTPRLLPRADEPWLTAEFPPQHVMQRSFLRQELSLPDLGRAVTPSDARTLRRGGEAARALRQAIYDAKIQGAPNDPAKPGFDTFATKWRERHGTPWIGPRGLTTVRERQAARKLAVDLVTQQRNVALTALSAEPPTPAAIRSVIDALALPRMSFDRVATTQATQASEGDRRAALHAYLRRSDRDYADITKPDQPILWLDPATDFGWPLSRTHAAMVFAPVAPPETSPAEMRDFLREVAKQRHDEGEELGNGPEGLIRPVEARLAGVTRLVFRYVPSHSRTDAPGLPLTLAALTNWPKGVSENSGEPPSPFQLEVSRRAARVNEDDIAGYLAKLNFRSGPGIKAADRMADIFASLADEPDKTRIEVPARVYLSPAADAGWIVSPAPTDSLALLFNVRLREASPSVRAIGSPDFVREVFNFSPDGAATPPPLPGLKTPWSARFRTALDAADRHEFVQLTAAHGLPVVGVGSASDLVAKRRSRNARPPEGFQLPDLLHEDGVDDQGIYLPPPLQVNYLALQAIGATLRSNNAFEPPAAARLDNQTPYGKALFATPSVERWNVQITDGQDVVTTVVRRGYLMPFCHKAALVKQSSPRLRWALNGYIWEQATRFYIEVTRDEQRFPLVGQPFLARGCGLRSARLLTLRTPDLIDPTDGPLPSPGNDLTATLRGDLRGRVSGLVQDGMQQRPTAGMTFWPRTELGAPGSVRFRLSINGAATPVAMPLLFLDNAAANDPETVRALCERYYQRPPEDGDGKPSDWDIMRHGGTDLPYAAEKKEGDCTLTTNWQRWGVEGRAGLRPYLFGAELQTAQQPPFYPKMIEAEVTSKQIQGLTGATASPFLVRFNRDYVGRDFTNTAVEQQTFLDVHEDRVVAPGRITHPRPSLSMKANGDRSGGLVRPAMKLGGWNREVGPVGHVSTHSASNDLVTLTADGDAQVGSPVQLAALKEMKILGLISAEKLLELLAGGSTLDAVQPVVQDIATFATPPGPEGEFKRQIEALANLLEGARRGIEGYRDAPVVGALDGDLQRFAEALRKIIAAKDSAATLIAATSAWSAGKELERALQRLAAAPVGAVADSIRAALAGELNGPFGIEQTLRAQGAEFLAEQVSTGPWARLLVRALPIAPQFDDVLEQELRVAVRDPAAWLTDDPVASILETLRKNSAVTSILENVTRDLLVGPAYAVIEPLLTLLRQRADAGIAALTVLPGEIEAALRPLRTAAAEQVRETCNAAARLFDALLIASYGAVDSGGARVSLGPVAAAAQALESGASELDRVVDRLPTDPNGTPYADALRTLGQRWRLLAARLLRALTEFQAAFAQLDLGAACRTFDFAELEAAMQRVRDAKRRLDEVLFDEALLEAMLPLGPVPAAIEREWAAVPRRIAGAVLPALRLAIETSLGGADAAALRNLQGAIDNLKASDSFKALAAQALNTLTQQLSGAHDEIVRLQGASIGLHEWLAQAGRVRNSLATALTVTGRMVEARLIELALQTSMLPRAGALIARLVARFDTVLPGLYRRLVELRIGVWTQAQGYNDRAQRLLGDPPASAGWCGGGRWADAILLVPRSPTSIGELCEPGNDALTDEAGLATAQLLQPWREGRSAPQRLAAHVARLGDLAAQASLRQLLHPSPGELLQEVTRTMEALVQVNRRLDSHWQMDLEPGKELTLASVITFKPLKLPDAKSTISFDSHIQTTIVPAPAVSAAFSASIPAFSLNIKDVLTIQFAQGIKFAGGSGRRSSITAPIGDRDIEFGPILKFLEKLQEYLNMGDPDQGPYMRIHVGRPMIEAGYRLAIPVITAGITFTNVNFFGAILLPLDERECRVKLALGSSELPFMISAGIYGGAAFFGCELSTRGVESFEASFQFGGVASIGYGPLRGIAYVLTGAYIRKEGQLCSFSVLFSAGFSAHIACFSICASFVLRLESSGDGGVSGFAELRFSFSVGFATVSYNVRVERRIAKGFGNAGSSPTNKQASDSKRAMLASPDMTECATDRYQQAQLITISPVGLDDWPGYASQFDNDIRPAAYT